MLNSSIAEQCFNLLLLSDGLVEGTEIVMLTLQLNSNIFGIRDIAPNTTVVTIIDEDCESVEMTNPSFSKYIFNLVIIIIPYGFKALSLR